MKLSEYACKNAKHKNPQSKAPMKLSDGDGLSLWVMPNGAKYWRFAYRFGGKQKSLAIGVYPETSLKEARMARFNAREDVEAGKDPNLEKKKKAHLVPLSDQAIEILKEQKDIAGKWPWILPSPVRPRQAISNNAILVALKRMGYQGRMTGHGFRALAMSSIKQELGWRHEVVDRQLAHQPKNKIDRAYDRALFLDDRKKMMQEWADYIDKLL